ncbi:MAG TPA: PfkB family carbohydrate kinase [Saprospiraceae bacterium]|nr:PfkB family carbohydrate kinase [Saprospiraceae bacterium]
MSLLTVGTVAFDTIETPSGRAEMVIGGAAMYIAWAASYLTQDVRIVSIIGGDFPEHELDLLRKRGVDTAGIQCITHGRSFFWEGRYHDNMISRDTLVTDLNVLADFDPVLPDSYRNSDYLMLGNLTPEIQKKVIDQMTTRPRMIALDTMNFWMNIAWDSVMEVIRLVDILIINDDEARQMSGEHSLVKAAGKIHALGPKYLVIKKGEHGALLFHRDRVFFAPGLPLLEVVDPTGAGDTFAGGFMGYLASSHDMSFENLRRAIIYGSVMASFCVEDFSLNKLRNLTKDNIEKRYEAFRELVHF